MESSYPIPAPRKLPPPIPLRPARSVEEEPSRTLADYDRDWREASGDAEAEPSPPSGGFGMIPAEVYELGDGYALAVYAALAKHANADGECWPSPETIMKATGWTRPTIRKAIRRLADAGLVVVSERSRRGARVTLAYRLTRHSTVKPRFTENGPRGNEVSPHGETTFPRTVKRGFTRTIPIEQDQSNNVSVNPPSPQKASTPTTTKAPPAREGFDRWYAAYPKHVKRADAERAWAKLPPDAPDADALIAAVKAQRLDERDWRYRPHPASWLNGACWSDEPPPPPVPRAPSPNGHRPAPAQVERGNVPSGEDQKARFREMGRARRAQT